MEIRPLRLAEIPADDTFRLVQSPQPQAGADFLRRFPGLPGLVVDGSGRLVAGDEVLAHLRAAAADTAPALVFGGSEKEGLFFACNWRQRFLGLDLAARLLFLHKILPLADLREIYAAVELDIAVNAELLRHLPTLVGAEFRPLLADGCVGLKCALRLAGWEAAARAALGELFTRVRFSESQQGRICDLVEEIAFRDKIPFAAVLAAAGVDELLGGEMPQKRILAALEEVRYPEFCAAQKRWRAEVAGLRLPPQVRLEHAPFFEKKRVQVTLEFPDFPTARRWLSAMAKADGNEPPGPAE